MIPKPILLIFLLLISGLMGFPLQQNSKVPPAKVLDFLKNYGYINEEDSDSAALYTEEGISETIKVVQKFGAINQTGILDNDTLELMASPRCGVADISKKHQRSRRFATNGDGWNKRFITYYIANWSPKLSEQSVAKNIQLSLEAWGEYSNLRFSRSQTPDADIIVAFGGYYHGDVFPFDGKGGVLAHAFFPSEQSSFAGDVHFDADEDWTDKQEESDIGMDFGTVALHELGHSLGLSHSPVSNSVMFPYYKGFDPNRKFQIEYDDVLGMHQLYIRRHIPDTTASHREVPSTKETQTIVPSTKETQATVTFPTSTDSTSAETTSTTLRINYEDDYDTVDVHRDHSPSGNVPLTNSPGLPNICDGIVDAVASLRNELFIFRDEYVWRMRDIGKILPGYPITIHQMFPELPKSIKNIDAAYQRPDGMIILFTGQIFWIYDGRNFIDGSPRPLSDYGLPENLKRIDAVQTWARNGKTYFYLRDRFWRYNETAGQMDRGYPMHMERWSGVPHDLDASTTWKETTYFFKDGLYYKFDNDWVVITDQSPLPYPQIWLGCPEDERILQLYGS